MFHVLLTIELVNQRGDDSLHYLNLSEENIIINLKDAGCKQETIDKFIYLYRKKDVANQITLLRLHRQKLLDRLHSQNKQIDCLDYLLYQIKKDNL